MALTKVTNTGIADDAVTTDKIEDGTVVAADIAPGTIANAKLANSSITVNGSSVSLGGAATLKHIDWQALTVADGSTTLNAEAGKGYFLDTNAGVIEVFLPSSPTRGDTVVLADYSGTFATNQIIINTGGELLDSTAGNDFKVTTNNSIVELIYVDSAKGWLVKLNQAAGTTPSSVLTEGVYDTDLSYIEATGGTVVTSGDDKIHVFTGDGCFVVSSLGNCAGGGDKVSYLVVAGGGGGASTGGGGGGGGYREGKDTPKATHTASPKAAACSGLTVTATTFPITVGGGGSGSGGSPAPSASDGNNSVFSTITSTGGGGGGGYTTNTSIPGHPGGSGGGGNASNTGNCAAGGTGNTPPVSPSQGNNGGIGAGNLGAGWYGGGGGGGALGTGQNHQPPMKGGDGGDGAGTQIVPNSYGESGPGCNQYFSGGGGGGGQNPSSTIGGVGGGGDHPGCGVGATNTGGGGAGANCAGGKGIVVIRYKYQ